jgi:hypothetical protein
MTTSAADNRPGMRSGFRKARGGKVAYAAIGVLVGICAIGWAIITAYAEGVPGINPEVVSWQAADTSVRVHFQIGKPKGHDVQCALVAYDTSHGVVGHADVVVPRGTSSVDTIRTLPTSSRATSVDVTQCHTG